MRHVFYNMRSRLRQLPMVTTTTTTATATVVAAAATMPWQTNF
jgi:hypothetical protein